MKKLINLLLVISMMYSCSKDDEKNIQRWDLVRMAGQIENSETTGKNMSWQEFYVFKNDGTFIKSRDRNGIITTASGSFTKVTRDEGTFLELKFKSGFEIIGSCYANEIETLWLKTNDLLVNTWSQCDGPGLEYENKSNL